MKDSFVSSPSHSETVCSFSYLIPFVVSSIDPSRAINGRNRAITRMFYEVPLVGLLELLFGFLAAFFFFFLVMLVNP